MRLSGSIFSKALDMDTGLTVLTPNKYQPGKEYPVVYVLHGICGDSRTWRDYSMLPAYALSGETIYILPDAARSFYADMRIGFPYFTYLTEELPAICKSLFHITADRAHTGVMGASMGGYGALKCALTYPERYGMCAAFSACCLEMEREFAALRALSTEQALVDALGEPLKRDLVAAFGPDFACTEADDVCRLAARAKASGSLPQLYLTCGTKDSFYENHRNFSAVLDQLGVLHTLECWEAGHDLFYFNEALHRAIQHFAL